MLVLSLDTATAATAVALLDLDRSPAVLASRSCVDPRAHGEQLAPQIRAVLAEAGRRPADLTAVVAGLGPGPYTGLRVGLVTAASLGQALGVPTYGVCSLDGIDSGPGPALVATDARRREVYWAVYAGGRRLTGPAVDRPAELAPVLAAHGVTAAYGEGAQRYRDVLGLPVAEQPSRPDPARLAELAADRVRAGAPSERLTPLYLRRPDAAQPHPPKPATPR